MVKWFCVVCAVLGVLSLSACGKEAVSTGIEATPSQTVIAGPGSDAIDQKTDTGFDGEAFDEEVSEKTQSSQEEAILKITVGDYEFHAVFEDNSSAAEFKKLLAEGPITIEMEDYGGFEKVGSLGTRLTRNDEQITTEPGDVILYQGNQITIYYDTNSWNFTRLAKITDVTNLKAKLGQGTVQVTFSLE